MTKTLRSGLTLYSLACPVCSSAFSTRHKNQKTCSPRCGGISRGQPKKSCGMCGSPVTPTSGSRKVRFCSVACYRKSRMTTSVSQEFLDRMSIPEPNSGCFLWLGSVDRDGYGRFSLAKKAFRAARVSLELSGVKPPPDALVLHHCDTPACINPFHLYWGDAAANAKDGIERGRFRLGSYVHLAKLTDEDVSEIRRLLTTGESQEKIAARFGVKQITISDIKLGKTWKRPSRAWRIDAAVSP